MITWQRHGNCMQKSIEHLWHFNLENPTELMSEDLRLAAFELGVVTGVINIEEILSSVFNNFCMGK